jgi:aspartate/methionine/tyrosine aminotransferase
MRIETFLMERMQSTWENLVEFNLSESGVHPLRVRELLDRQGDVEPFLDQELAYTQSNGTPSLRAAVAALYPGATVDHVQVTNGGSEANYLATWNLVEPGDEVVMMVPNYMQTWGLVRGFGGKIRKWPLREATVNGSARWRPDLDELRTLVTPRTKLIVVCNPNNPTGARLDAADLDAICDAASRRGAWILSDEIYRGAEMDGQETPSVWGRYERVLVTSGLSKAYGLPGLRIGWVAGPPDMIAKLWSYHDYTTIAPGALSDFLARVALAPARRPRLLERTRGILHRNYPVLKAWLDARREAFTLIPPEAGAIAYVRYHHGVNSTVLVNRLREEKSTLVVPGDHFEMDGYLRIGFGYGGTHAYLRDGLGRLGALFDVYGQATEVREVTE